MSLIRQLWLTVVISTLLALTGSLLIGIFSARDYLVEQLARQNSDNASSLALSMTQREKNLTVVELQVAALFDTGYYQEIRVADPFGKALVERVQEKRETSAPGWFTDLLPIVSRPGVAQVNDGWKQFATVQVISHTDFAYQALWQQTKSMLLWFILGGAAIGLLGMMVLRSIGQAIGQVVEQANAIGQRRFISVPLPKTPELRILAEAMNSMVERVRQMFSDEAARVENLRRRVHFDQATGLPNRDYFMAQFREELANQEGASQGLLAILRLTPVSTLNNRLGSAETERLLSTVGEFWGRRQQMNPGAFGGRVKLEDFALLVPGQTDVQNWSAALHAMIQDHLASRWPELRNLYHLGVVQYQRSSQAGDILSAADHALAVAEGKGPNESHAITSFTRHQSLPGTQWKSLLTEAISAGKLQLMFYPVVGSSGEVLHQEGMIRLMPDDSGSVLTAAEFMPVAAHLHLTGPLDMSVVRLAIEHLASVREDVAINLSPSTLNDWGFHHELVSLLKRDPELCHRLWFEVPEHGALAHFDAFRSLCEQLKQLGCHVGVEQFELQLAESRKLTELGLDYVKLPPGLLANLQDNPGNREYLQRFCSVVHGLGITVIAVGLQSDGDWEELKKLGIDAATGPGIRLSN